MLENPIDLKQFPIANYVNNKKWLLISRVDSDKIDEIKLIINKMNNYDIKHIDILGDGSEFNNLNEYLKNNKLTQKVSLKGYSNRIYNEVNNNYNGIIGIGRVILEGLAMKLPCILIGNNKITGFVNENVYNEIKDINFINRTTNIVNNKMVTYEELQRINYDLINKFNVDIILKKYVDILLNSNSIYMPNLISLYGEIKKFLDNDQLKKCYFHKERLVYNLVETYVNKFSGLSDISIISTNTNLVYELYDLTTYKMDLIREGEK